MMQDAKDFFRIWEVEDVSFCCVFEFLGILTHIIGIDLNHE
jgi:hypothetical protein